MDTIPQNRSLARRSLDRWYCWRSLAAMMNRREYLASVLIVRKGFTRGVNSNTGKADGTHTLTDPKGHPWVWDDSQGKWIKAEGVG